MRRAQEVFEAEGGGERINPLPPPFQPLPNHLLTPIPSLGMFPSIPASRTLAGRCRSTNPTLSRQLTCGTSWSGHPP
eukprot:1017894-Prorocentrum_minimum.AAC.6